MESWRRVSLLGVGASKKFNEIMGFGLGTSGAMAPDVSILDLPCKKWKVLIPMQADGGF